MKYLKPLGILSACVLMTSCAQSLSVSKKETFEQKSGIIGVFRQPVGFCSGGYQQQIKLGGEKIIVKPTWTSEQDNLFSAYIQPGNADLESYRYSCGFTETTLKPIEKHGVVIPQNGFCKIVISFLNNDELFSKNEVLLFNHFKKEEVAKDLEEIPYCETY
ncbi:MAG: hypothetical protein IJM92_02575 [Fibrobacter sp.]|uniref:hypothetical protein n=1 Tax=Fibrobacter sp. TaxID=35828 RepID=UPI0025B8C31D|nr:hypothetical protein [Fibrobacter sp.]MBQ7078556.1 hypothetical protein [Fibrobacter sp.]